MYSNERTDAMTDEQIAAQIKADIMIGDEIAELEQQLSPASDHRREQITQQINRLKDTIIKNSDKMTEADRYRYLAMRRQLYRR